MPTASPAPDLSVRFGATSPVACVSKKRMFCVASDSATSVADSAIERTAFIVVLAPPIVRVGATLPFAPGEKTLIFGLRVVPLASSEAA